MGKKRRLIKKSNKFTTKHSSHPILKYINGKTQPIEKDVTEIIEETKVEIKTQPIVATENKTAPRVKKTVTKKTTPKIKAKSKTTKRVKKTKPTTDKAI